MRYHISHDNNTTYGESDGPLSEGEISRRMRIYSSNRTVISPTGLAIVVTTQSPGIHTTSKRLSTTSKRLSDMLRVM